MTFQVPLYRKEPEIQPEPCEIIDAVELSYPEFEYFRKHLLYDNSFIAERADELGTDEQGVNQCLLVLCEGAEHGILVNSQGYGYARYAAFVPLARTMYAMDLQQKEQEQEGGMIF